MALLAEKLAHRASVAAMKATCALALLAVPWSAANSEFLARTVKQIGECKAELGCYANYQISADPEIELWAYEISAQACLDPRSKCHAVREGRIALVNHSEADVMVCVKVWFHSTEKPEMMVCERVEARSTRLRDCPQCNAEIGGRIKRVDRPMIRRVGQR